MAQVKFATCDMRCGVEVDLSNPDDPQKDELLGLGWVDNGRTLGEMPIEKAKFHFCRSCCGRLQGLFDFGIKTGVATEDEVANA